MPGELLAKATAQLTETERAVKGFDQARFGGDLGQHPEIGPGGATCGIGHTPDVDRLRRRDDLGLRLDGTEELERVTEACLISLA